MQKVLFDVEFDEKREEVLVAREWNVR